MQAFSEDKRDFLPLVNELGLYYQIRDDYINLQSNKYMENKSFCEDLSEGKFSFPIIHSIQSNPNDKRLLSMYPPLAITTLTSARYFAPQNRGCGDEEACSGIYEVYGLV